MKTRGGWTAWAAAWVSILVATTLAAVVLAELSADSAETALDEALGEHLLSQSGLLAGALAPEPLDLVWKVGGSHSFDALRARLDALALSALLHDAVVIPPQNASPLTRDAAREWLAARADAPLIEVAQHGQSQLGPMYRATDGALYRTAYSPVPGHPGWVVGVEGSGATLSAVDRLEHLQFVAGSIVFVLAGGLGALLALALTRPLHKLDRQLAAARPGASPSQIEVQGPREVRRLATSAQALLAAIQERDATLERTHRQQIAQITALAATVAHEVRNPLNALGLTVDRLGRATETDQRNTLAARASGCVGEIERIVQRFLDLSRPITPHITAVDVTAVARAAAEEFAEAVVVHVEGPAMWLATDAELVGQVLRNLLRNAVEAGASVVRVSAKKHGLIVLDDGPGIAPDDANHIFEWFHTTRAQGTGLGLPLSRRLCQALGGDLTLLSGSPTTLYVRLRPEGS